MAIQTEISTAGGLGALEHHELPGVTPSLAWSLEQEPGEDAVIDPAFFRKMESAQAHEYTWEGWSDPPNRFPMAYSNVTLIAATFTIPVEQAQALLPSSQRLKLVRVAPRRALITFFAFDYRKGGLGAYHELGVGLPVVLDRPAPPLLPALVETVRRGSYPGIGAFVLELPVDQPRACEAGIRLYGLPKVVGTAQYALKEHSGSAALDHDGMRMAELRVSVKPAERKRLRLPLRTVSVLDGRITTTDYETIGEGYAARSGEAEFRPGDHPRFARFTDLSLSANPVEVQVVHKLNWIIWGPQDRGAL